MKDTEQPATHRVHELDALRGIALLGILIVNIFIFHAPYLHFSAFYGAFDGVQGEVVAAVTHFAAGKSLFIFAFLFGYGMAVQKQLKGMAFNAYHVKRMCVLLGVGILHIVLFWFGDILASYAILGGVMLLLIRLSDSRILGLGIFFILVRPLYYFVSICFELPHFEMEAPITMQTFMTTFQEGSYHEIFRLRMQEFYAFMPENIVWFLPKILGLFLIGFYAKNKSFITRITENPLKNWGIFIGLIAVSLFWIIVKSEFFAKFDLEAAPLMRPVLIGINVVFETAQGMAYIMGLILIFQKARVLTKLLAATGRMALTNYMMQSLICVGIFYSYGLGFYGKLRPSDLVWISIAIFTFNMWSSNWYLKTHTLGPLEYLWRQMIK